MVAQYRSIRKALITNNSALPKVEVVPQTYDDFADWGTTQL